MSETKRPRQLTVRQWLALDAAGTFLAGCGIFFYSGYLLCQYDDWGVVFGAILYTFPVPLVLDLAALFLLMARSSFPAWRILGGIGAVIQTAAAVYHFWGWQSLDGILNQLMLPMLLAGIAGLGAALCSPRAPKPPAE